MMIRTTLIALGLLLFAGPLITGCVDTPTTVTGGSVRRESATLQQVTYPPAYPAELTLAWPATMPAIDWSHPAERVTFFPPSPAAAAPVVTTSITSSVATSQPSVTSSDQTQLKLAGSTIAADGSLGGFTLSAIPIPQPRSGWWVYLLSITFVLVGVACIAANFKLGVVPVWLGPVLIALGFAAFFMEPYMLTIALIVVAVVATLVAVYFLYKHGTLQAAVAKIDTAFSASSLVTSHADPHAVVQSTLNDSEQALLPKTTAAATAVSAVPTPAPAAVPAGATVAK